MTAAFRTTATPFTRQMIVFKKTRKEWRCAFRAVASQMLFPGGPAGSIDGSTAQTLSLLVDRELDILVRDVGWVGFDIELILESAPLIVAVHESALTICHRMKIVRKLTTLWPVATGDH